VVGVDRLHPVERRRCVADLPDAAVIAPLAAPDAAEVEPHDRAAEPLERLEHRVRDAVVHRSAVQRMRVQHQRDRSARVLRMVVTAFKPTVRTGKHHLRHGVLTLACFLSSSSGSPNPRKATAEPQPLV
jgi:hypothetical protein